MGEQKFSLADESCGLSQRAGSGPGFHVNTEAVPLAGPPMGRESLCRGRGKPIARVRQAVGGGGGGAEAHCSFEFFCSSCGGTKCPETRRVATQSPTERGRGGQGCPLLCAEGCQRASPVRKPVLCNDVLGGSEIARREEWGGTREAESRWYREPRRACKRACVVLLDSCNGKGYQADHVHP